MTLRDETGYCNALAWPSIFDRYRREIMGSRIIVIEGEVPRSPEGVTHLITEKCYDRSSEIERLSEDHFKPQSHDDQIRTASGFRWLRAQVSHASSRCDAIHFHAIEHNPGIATFDCVLNESELTVGYDRYTTIANAAMP